MTQGVKEFLRSLSLERYYDMFLAKGFDLESDICNLDTTDLDSMYISEDRHRKQILEAVTHFIPSKEFLLYEWLREKGLDHYFIGFVQSDLVELSSISRLNLPDDDLYDELEITLPGHKRRLERAVRQLAKKHRMSLPTFSTVKDPVPSKETSTKTGDLVPTSEPEDKMEIPVAYGRWGKPKCLREAKYDFLILDAIVASTRDPLDRVQIEFMVDSGSDVVTIREEVLDSLDLELIGPIKSTGVHASRTKNLYRANMIIGNQTVEIEVMGESYDSIGSRVIRHFRHYITGNRHIWLKGDYIDSSMLPPSQRHVGLDQTVSVDSLPGSSSQGQSIIQHEVPASATLPASPEVSQPQALPISPIAGKSEAEPEEKRSGEVEETIDESMEVTDEAKVQKDSAILNGRVKPSPGQAALKAVESVEFSFKTSPDVEGNVGEKSDETDLLLVKDDGIIDVRPFIEANRAKHAKGFADQPGARHFETKIRIDNGALENGLDVSLIRRDEPKTLTAHLPKVQENIGGTFLGQRSVYYRSQQQLQNENIER